MYNSNTQDNNNDVGHSLGGRTAAASADEMRQRRLAALGGNQASAGNMTTTTTPPKSQPMNCNVVHDTLDQDEDADLQAALALSLHKEEEPMELATNTNDNNLMDHDPIVTTASFDTSQFHSIMWDHVMTTDNDKLRWVGQGIHTTTCQEETRGAATREVVKDSDSALNVVGSNHGPWGLTQTHGGPCGVLAAVQAELLRLVLFGRSHDVILEYPTHVTEQNQEETKPSADALSPELIQKGLAMAIAIILARAAMSLPANDDTKNNNDQAAAARVHVVLPTNTSKQPPQEGLTWDDLEPWPSSSSATGRVTDKLCCHIVSVPLHQNQNNAKRQRKNSPKSKDNIEKEDDRTIRLALAVSNFLLQPLQEKQQEATAATPLDSFCRPGGVMLLVMSLVASRGSNVIQSDMDDPSGTRLTSQFGHCSQELINLLLTGQAVSNVFDNTLTPSGALTCRGVQSRPAVGYLSQLESLRYCEVGGYYKSPTFPIWVVGSTSHFTVLFGDAKCLAESKSDVLLETCRRAFKAVEGGEENGFIDSKQLGQVLNSLNLNVEPSAAQTLAAMLEVSGAGIILWDDFWKASSRLMTGASIQSVLQGDSGDGNPGDNNNMPPSVITTSQGGHDTTPPRQPTATVAPKSLVESDEELARRLNAEWNSPAGAAALHHGSDAATVSSMDAVAARPASPIDVDATPGMSDEEYARLLQAEYEPSSKSESKTNDGAIIVVDQPQQTTNAPAAASSMATATTTPPSTPQRHEGMEYEQFGNSFQLYHYNGLRGGTLTPFVVTRLSAEEAVGHSIALTHAVGGAGSSQHGASRAAGGGDLEDVVRTKWPSCSINWMGNPPPYID